MDVQVNYIVLVIACLASVVVGYFWYSPKLFGNTWMQLMGYTEETIKSAQKHRMKMYALNFVTSLATAFVLFHVMSLSQTVYHLQRMSTGLIAAFWMWFGFVMPVQLTNVMFGDKKWKLFAINTSYQYISLLVMAIILTFA